MTFDDLCHDPLSADNDPPMRGRLWSAGDLLLAQLQAEGRTWAEIGTRLDRSVSACAVWRMSAVFSRG